MSWASENKFLVGYGIVMVLGVGALGYQVFSASSAYDDATAEYTTKASTYNTLRHTAPHPNRENLASFEAQKKEAAAVVSAFQADLAKREFPMEPMTPEKFQDTLRKAVADLTKKAADTNVSLKTAEKFYLGFNAYETKPPEADATTTLGRDLKAIDWFINQLVDTPIIELRKLTRPEFPGERGAPAAGATPPRPPAGLPGAGRPGAGATAANLLSTHAFEVVIFCRQHQLAKILDTLVNPNTPQFFILRSIRIVNEQPKPPPRVDPAAAGAPPSGNVLYIVGTESVEATLRVEIVDFAEPAAPAAAAK